MTEPRQRQSTEFNEADAIERAKQGDAEAFQALYDRHKRRVYSLCLRMTANTAKDFGADDVALAGSIDRLQLQRAVDSLPPGYRTIFVLHDVEGYEHNEIAGIVGCSIGNSKSQLHKARMKLRDLLKMNRAEKAGIPKQ